MTSTQIAVLVVVVIAVIAVVVVLILQNRTKKLRARFGPEYDRAVAEKGNRFKAEQELEKVEKRVKNYDIRPLTAADRDRFQQSWRTVQAKFVDDPAGAFVEADQLLGAVMLARGYPPLISITALQKFPLIMAWLSRNTGRGMKSRSAIHKNRRPPKICGEEWFTTARYSTN
jgi:hypothetical protein